MPFLIQINLETDRKSTNSLNRPQRYGYFVIYAQNECYFINKVLQ